MKSPNESLSYDEAKKQLEQILLDIQSADLPFSSLRSKIKEGKTLLAKCHQLLKQEEQELRFVTEEE